MHLQANSITTCKKWTTFETKTTNKYCAKLRLLQNVVKSAYITLSPHNNKYIFSKSLISTKQIHVRQVHQT